ncbi:MAG: M42 family metallopeptidase [Oscillospiraceae bacterium]|jgi:putative aminopeptidase FrvX|nr:M42 family metallopeptidase [Oscillospiraceae bacterium]
MPLYDTLEKLCGLAGPSGFEGPVSAVAKELLEPLMDEVSLDRLGSVIGLRRCGKANAKRLLLDAHLDEIGLIVTGIEEGFLCFAPLGGVDPRMLPARELTILTKPEPLFGVVVCLPPHVQSPSDYNKSVSIEYLRIDVGMTQEQAEKAIPIGTPIVYREGCFRLAGDQVCGKSLDDRACFSILLRTAELLKDQELDVDLYIMGSVREEVSGTGAIVGTNAVAPDWCVAVDVTHAATPDLSHPKDRTCELNAGPAIGVGPNMTWSLTDRMVDKAKTHEIPYQLEVMEGHTGTNGWHMQVCLEGIPTSVVSLPLKYMHSPIEVVSLGDMERTAQLLAAFVKDLGKEGC